ncbi:MraY family glycosyltransferase [Microbacterium sp.]|uniref:MraY family glycosyltransferase n=1 Tax=Microbacterium sp. TaxID=51671 RepID=UPI003C79173F
MRFYVLTVVVTAAATLALTWAVWRIGMRYRLYPEIRERDVHKTPKPRVGGVAMFLGILVAFALSSQVPYFAIFWGNPAQVWSILGASLLIVVVGVADDLWDLDWMIKLGAQFLAAGIVVGIGGVQIFFIPLGGQIVFSSWVSFTLAVFAIVIVMNAVNFIDGLDGLVAGVALISNFVFFVYSYLVVRDLGASSYSNLASFIAVALIGACVGFLPLNWSPSKLFMGDSGALLLGLLMATSGILFAGGLDPTLLGDNDVFGRSQLLGAYIPILLPVVVVLLPLLDFGMAVIRRMSRGQSPFSPDRKHLHHRMLDMGHSDRDAVLVFYAWTAVVSIGVLLMYIGTTQDWPGEYGFGLGYVVIGIAACLVVTLVPQSRVARSARPPVAPAPASEHKPEPRTS